MDRTESMRELQNSEAMRKPFIAPTLVAQGTLVEDTGAFICFDSGGNLVQVDGNPLEQTCEDFGLFDSPPGP
jgi:hypothetical protein